LNIFIHPNFSSPLVWDVIVISCYIVLTFLSVYFQLLPDCKKNGLWFFNGSIRNQSLEDVEKKSATWSKRIGLIALPFAIGIHTVTALIFATQNTHEWWHTAVLPPDFIAMAVASGGSLVLILAVVLSGKSGFEKNLEGYRIICKIIATALAVHFFFVAMELILAAWTGSVSTNALLQSLFGTYGPLYATELILPIVAMVMFFTNKWAASMKHLLTGTILILLGTFAHRLMILFPAFANSNVSFNVLTNQGMVNWLYPVSTGRIMETGMAFSSTYAYVPTGIEYLVALLPFGLLLTVLSLMILKYPIITKE
jgi:molybdopterin-containing oxidoreductase family membrane subunit